MSIAQSEFIRQSQFFQPTKLHPHEKCNNWNRQLSHHHIPEKISTRASNGSQSKTDTTTCPNTSPPTTAGTTNNCGSYGRTRTRRIRQHGVEWKSGRMTGTSVLVVTMEDTGGYKASRQELRKEGPSGIWKIWWTPGQDTPLGMKMMTRGQQTAKRITPGWKQEAVKDDGN